MTNKYKNNFKVFTRTIKTLSNSQGYYSRMWNNIKSKSYSKLKNFRNVLNNIDIEFKDSVDVILFIEG